MGALAFSAPLGVVADSLLMNPLHLGETPPGLWCVRALSLGYGEGHARSKEEAEAELEGILEERRDKKERKKAKKRARKEAKKDTRT